MFYTLFMWAHAHPIAFTLILIWIIATYYIIAWGGTKAGRRK